MPSLQLTKIYESALFDSTVGDIDNHPQQAQSGGADIEQPLLHLGDLFINKQSKAVWQVITAQCDLAFSPLNPKRSFDKEQAVLMIPGKLHPLGSPEAQGKLRTELFEYEESVFCIVWDPKKVTSQLYGEIGDWEHKGGFERIARLRLPYALEIQRAFAADLTRIGMPVAPPIYRPVIVELFFREDSEKVVPIELGNSDSAFIVLSREGEQCVLTVDCGCLLKAKIASLVTTLEWHQSTINASSKEFTKNKRRIKSLQELLDEFDDWFLNLGPVDIKAAGKPYPIHKNLAICKGANAETLSKLSTLLLVNIVDRSLVQEVTK